MYIEISGECSGSVPSSTLVAILHMSITYAYVGIKSGGLPEHNG